MAYTDAELLTQWQAARDRIALALATGTPIVEYTIGSTNVVREPTKDLYNLAVAEVARLTAAGQVGFGRHRNYLRKNWR
jgi:hypothetical protein